MPLYRSARRSLAPETRRARFPRPATHIEGTGDPTQRAPASSRKPAVAGLRCRRGRGDQRANDPTATPAPAARHRRRQGAARRARASPLAGRRLGESVGAQRSHTRCGTSTRARSGATGARRSSRQPAPGRRRTSAGRRPPAACRSSSTLTSVASTRVSRAFDSPLTRFYSRSTRSAPTSTTRRRPKI